MYDYTLYNADCITTMSKMPDNSFESIITDPPYELGFLGNGWDRTGIAFEPATWSQCLRVAKPGAHLLAFGGSRTFHRLACAIERAGWEIRDCIMWLYGSGFPKSLNIGGIGTALKPAFEPIIVARKKLCGKLADNLRAWGCGGVNIAACRVPAEAPTGWRGNPSKGYGGGLDKREAGGRPACGRWPANVIHDGSPEVLSAFPAGADGLSPARFFYCAKAGAADREEGLADFPRRKLEIFHGKRLARNPAPKANLHPTVKPAPLMRYLCRLFAPPGGRILDPFAGSGSTGKAALLEGFDFTGIEKEKRYAQIAEARLACAQAAARA